MRRLRGDIFSCACGAKYSWSKGVNVGSVGCPRFGACRTDTTSDCKRRMPIAFDMPLVDLFLWGSPQSTADRYITSAIDIGPSSVDGTTCEQYAFRQDGLDWQIWIQQGNVAGSDGEPA